MHYGSAEVAARSMEQVKISFEHTMRHGREHKYMADRIFDAARTEESIINKCERIENKMWEDEYIDPREIAPEVLDILNRQIPLFIQESKIIGDGDPNAFNEIVYFVEQVSRFLSSAFEDRFRIEMHKPTPRRAMWWMESEKFGFR